MLDLTAMDIAINLIITAFVYLFVPVIALRGKQYPLPKIKKIVLINGIVCFLIFSVIQIEFGDGSASAGAFALWSGVGYSVMKKRCLKDTTSNSSATSSQTTDQTEATETKNLLSNADEAAHQHSEQDDISQNSAKVRFCYHCGFKLVEESRYCSRCGTAVINEEPSEKADVTEKESDAVESVKPQKSKSAKKVKGVVLVLCVVFLLLAGFIISKNDSLDKPIESVSVWTVTFDDGGYWEAKKCLLDFTQYSEKRTERDFRVFMESQGIDATLYKIQPGYFVEEIDTWCFDVTRRAGDITVIENDYGFTLCYISAVHRK